MFITRIFLYLAACVLTLRMPQQTVTLFIIAAVGITWAVDFFTGATFWISGRRTMLFLYAAYFILLAIWTYYSTSIHITNILTLLVLTIALSSDAIVNSSRWKIFLIAFAVSVGYWITTGPAAQDGAISPYLVIPVLAILARYLFPHTKHLLHTSLDYRYLRLEVLSLGMKRVAAVGIRRNKLHTPP